MNDDTTTRRRPLITRIATLERRRQHLRDRAKDPKRRQASIDFDLAEAGALDDAITALRRYMAEQALGTTAIELLQRARAAVEASGKTWPAVFPDSSELLETIDALLLEVKP